MSGLPIGTAAAAAACGLSAHTLRAWERRYGFPKPARTGTGERVYTADDVRRLTLMRRLIERGHRAGNIVRLDAAALEELAGPSGGVVAATPPVFDFQSCLAHLSANSLPLLRRLLQAALVRQGLERFILDTARPLIQLVGDWWAEGKLAVYQEHIFTEQMERFLREAMAPLEPDGGPTVVLTTFPGEKHGLALLLLEALLRLEGAACVPLGVETPPAEIIKFCATSDAQAVALSFSGSHAIVEGRRRVSFVRRELRDEVAVWAGGKSAGRVCRGVRGVTITPEFGDALTEFRALQRAT